MPKKIKVALIGVGNSASVLVQGLAGYRKEGEVKGLWRPKLGGYGLDDIEVVEAFDVNPRKTNRDLGEAVFAEPNSAPKYVDVEKLGIRVRRGILLDRLPEQVAKLLKVEKTVERNDVSAALKSSRVDVALNLIPSGLNKTSKAYAEAALSAGCSFINCTPSPVACDRRIVSAFKAGRQVVVGDDLMSQLGGTVFHKSILDLMVRRGAKVLKSYQLDVGGGAETLNTIDEEVKMVKRGVKTSAISAEVPYEIETVTGTTDYVDYMGNNRTSYYWILGEGFLGSPFKIDIYLRSTDGPNAANILLDTVRATQMSRERGRYGAPSEICGYGFKRPPTPIKLEEAYRRFHKTYIQQR